jgi:excisionase family DNA binding protein
MTSDIMEILQQPTCSVEEFRRVMGISKNPAYEAVKRGEVPSIRMGKRIRIPTAPLKVKLGLTLTSAEVVAVCR